MIKAPQNNLFVEVESEYNDEYTTKTGNKLYLSTTQFTSDDELDNSNFKPTMIRRHYGKVIGLPIKLTDSVKLRQVDPGLPMPGRYLSNEEISYSPQADSWSSLNSFVHKWKTCADFEMEVEMGDKIYFHHNTITDDNQVADIGTKTYKLGYQNAICVIRDNVIIPISGHVLVEPLWEEGVEDFGEGRRGKITKSGIISELHDKPEPLRAKVVAAGKPFKGEILDLKKGDKIMYLPHADYPVEIEGKTYYVMKYWEIIAKF